MKALRIATVFLLIAGCLLLASCDKADTLAVKGLNFDELTAVEYTALQMSLRASADEKYGYKGPLYHLFEENGELWLNVADSNDIGPFSISTGSRQLFAEDLGEWGGWVSTANFYSELSQGIVKPENVLTGVFVAGLYQKERYDPVAYILAGRYRDYKVYRFTDLNEKGWQLDVVAEPKINAHVALLDGDRLVIAASKGLLTVDVNTGETIILYDGEDWGPVYHNSIVKIGDSYFIGCSVGIHEYRISEEKMLFYPYPDYVPEEE